jgi:hypothetical protein
LAGGRYSAAYKLDVMNSHVFTCQVCSLGCWILSLPTSTYRFVNLPTIEQARASAMDCLQQIRQGQGLQPHALTLRSRSLQRCTPTCTIYGKQCAHRRLVLNLHDTIKMCPYSLQSEIFYFMVHVPLGANSCQPQLIMVVVDGSAGHCTLHITQTAIACGELLPLF